VGKFRPARDVSHEERSGHAPGVSIGPWQAWDRRPGRVFKPGEWHRRIRVRVFGGLFGVRILDGGTDKPLDRRGLQTWHKVLATVVGVGLVVILVAKFWG
jgi:hypothetical protein